MSDNILDHLNASQREAVEYCDGAQLIIAGAGAGKTRVLTYKIAYLLRNGLKPWNILALTFTNKAASEMKERISGIVGIDDARRLNMGTFHSIFSRILRVEASSIGYTPNFTIYDQSDSRSLVKAIIKEMALDDKAYNYTTVADRISMAKNRLLTPQNYAASQAADDLRRRVPAVKDIYARYAARCRQANAMDFDDLLLNTYILFSSNEDVRRKYVDRFHYVLVDEYQDTNFAQQSIIMQLTRERQKICVVGDDAQSIYGFRGADIDNILNFTTAFADARLFKLEQNYRSTQCIVQAANSLISHNSRQIKKEVFSNKEHGDKIMLKQTYSDRDEASMVCKEIRRIRKLDKSQYSAFAILYRTNSQSRVIEEELHKQDIPYRIFGGLSFYQRKEIKDIIAYLRLVVNANDEEAFRRVVNFPARGIGNVTVAKIVEAANENATSLWNVSMQPDAYGLAIAAGAKSKLQSFCSLVSGWAEGAAEKDAFTIGQEIVKESGIAKLYYGSKDPEDMARQENVTEFLAGMQDFVESRREEGAEDNVSLSDFLQEVTLLTDVESTADEAEGDQVSLMTIHSAKGLEFPNVFVVGLEENIFPSPMSCNSIRELEEERRLLYVAITRAERRCILSCAQSRFRYGKMEFDNPSRFLKDIDPAFLAVETTYSGGYQKSFQPRPRAYATFEADGNSVPTSASPGFAARRGGIQETTKTLDIPTIRPGALVKGNSRLRPISAQVPGASANASPAMPLPDGGIKVGNVIEHQRFGIGTVENVTGVGDNLKITVNFKNSGTKQLLLKFARYKVIK